jgi:ElaB/YqjD/DUF883 family membrane-anchored ribosome-binding protein
MFTAATKDDVETLKNTSQTFREADKTKDELRQAANKAGRRVRDLVETATDEIVHAKDTVTTQIRTKPVQSGLIALGVGFVLGALFRR